MGGGGANSLDSPKTGDNSDFESVKIGTDLSDKEEDTISEYTFKTYEEYISDLDVSSATITDNDLIGDGTSSNPYVILSIRGFLYIMNYAVSNKSLNSKYLELGTNIIFNDETFDINGNPSGGDGVVYSWLPASTGHGLWLDGNGHTISGLYFNDETRVGVSLFADGVKIKEISNLTTEDIYFKGKSNLATFAVYAQTIKNCVARNGTIIGGSNVSGIVCSITNYGVVENCINKCNIFATDNAEGWNAYGIVWSYENIIIKNCQNYGNVEAAKGYVGGICGGNYNGTMKIENCNNYGTLNSTSYIGGIVASSLRGNKQIINCTNYGTLIGRISVGGIVGYITSQVYILNCKSLGSFFVSAGSGAGIVGQVYFYSGIGAGDVVVEGSEIIIDENTSNCDYAFFGYLQHKMVSMVIKDCNVIVENYDNVSMMNCFSEAERFVMENINIDIKSASSERKRFAVIDTVILSSYSSFEIKNILIKSNFDNTRRSVFSYLPNSICKLLSIEGYIFESSQGQKLYYGGEFGDYYVSWKSGKIGLKTIDGKGLFQNTLNEQMLIDKGFTQISLK